MKYFKSQNGKPRQIDGEDASLPTKTARIDAAVIRFGAPSAESQTETDARPIRAALLERSKELVDIPTRQTAALILDLDQHALSNRFDSQRHSCPRPGELEGVLQKVPHDCGEDLPVSLDRYAVFDRGYRQCDATSVRLREEPEALVFARLFIDVGLLSLAPVLRHRGRNGVVKASVQRAKVAGTDRRIYFYGQLGDRLTHVAVVVDDLRDGQPLMQQIIPVLSSGPGDLRVCE